MVPHAPRPLQAGLMPDRVIYVEAGDEKSVLICFEEGLRHGGLGTVVAEVARLSMSFSPRPGLPPKALALSASPSAAGAVTPRPRGAPACASACPPLVAGLIVRDAESAADAGALDRLALWALLLRADRRRRSAGRAGDRRDRLSPLSPSADSRMFYDILKGMSGARRSGPVGDSLTVES